MSCCFKSSNPLKTLLDSTMILIKLGTGPASTQCKYMIVLRRNTVSTPSSPLLLKTILWNRWKCSSIWVFSYHIISLGVNMFHQFAGKSLAFSTGDSTTMHRVVLYFTSTSPLLDPIWIMPQPSGPLPKQGQN